MPQLTFSARDLVADSKSNFSIDAKGEELQRLQFALKVYNRERLDSASSLPDFTDDDSQNAQLYLIKQLRLPDTVSKDEVVTAVQERIQHLIDTTLPSSTTDMHAKLPRIKSVAVIGEIFNEKDESAVELWIHEINELIGEINSCIEQYNSAQDLQNKKVFLTRIQRLQVLIQHITPSDLVLYTNFSKVILHTLSDAIINESLRISMSEQEEDTSSLTQDHTQTEMTERQKLAKMLEVMPAEYLQRLALNLIIERKDANTITMASLILPHEPGYAEFHAFFTRNSFSFLGGNNSLNYKITSENGLEEFILKLEDRIGYTKFVEDRLRNSDFQKYLTTVDGERLISSGGRTNAVLLTDYCPDGDLLQFRKQLHIIEEVEQSALIFFVQMAEVYIELGHQDAATSDPKLTNWLIKNGMLVISDTKPFVTTENGMVTKQSIAKDNYGRTTLIGSPGFIPPEMKDAELSSDKMNSWIFGKNLYVYITKSNRAFKYDQACFKTPVGVKMAQLIKDLTKDSPEERISIQQALISLQKIEVEKFLVSMSEYRLDDEDAQMTAFITDYNNRLARPDISSDEIAVISAELVSICENLVKNAAALDKLRLRLEYSMPGTEEVVNAVRALPISERALRTEELIEKVELANKKLKLHNDAEYIQTKYAIGDDDLAMLRFIEEYNGEVSQCFDMENLNKLQVKIKELNATLMSCEYTCEQVAEIDESYFKQTMLPQLKATPVTQRKDFAEKCLAEIIALTQAKSIAHRALYQISSKYSLGEKDVGMRKFVSEYRAKIQDAKEVLVLRALQKELSQIQFELEAAKPHIEKIQGKIRKYRDNKHLQGHAKATVIENALLQVPVRQRSHIRQDDTVKKALGLKRWSMFNRIDTSTNQNVENSQQDDISSEHNLKNNRR